MRKAGIQYLSTKVRVRLDRGFSPFSNLATRTNCCKARIRSIRGKWLKGLPFPVLVYALLPMGLDYVHIQIQSGGCRSELGLAIHQQHRANPCHSLRTTAPLLPARGNSSERRTALGRGRRRDSGPRPGVGARLTADSRVRKSSPESAHFSFSHSEGNSTSTPSTHSPAQVDRGASAWLAHSCCPAYWPFLGGRQSPHPETASPATRCIGPRNCLGLPEPCTDVPLLAGRVVHVWLTVKMLNSQDL